jgi:hypothetical protein
MRKIGVRVQCSGLFAAPVLAMWAAPVIQEAHGDRQPPQWLPVATLAHLLMAGFLFVAPFAVQFLLRGQHSQIEGSGIDLNRLLLLMGLGGSATVSWVAAILVGFGETTEFLMGWTALSFAVGVFWGWRLRHVLR